ncbi:MAG: hypothetical protein PUA84_05240 [Oscillospiraceae bacterium]|nr:hypothetical protein [Oscillospiraceae bacterium]
MIKVKKIMAFILSAVICITCLGFMPDTFSKADIYADAADSGTCGDKLTWTFNNNTLTISGSGEMYDYKTSENPPWYLIRVKITKVVIEENVTSIGDNAFNICSCLKSIEIRNPNCDINRIPDGVVIFGYGNSTAKDYAKNNNNTFVLLPNGKCGDELE